MPAQNGVPLSAFPLCFNFDIGRFVEGYGKPSSPGRR